MKKTKSNHLVHYQSIYPLVTCAPDVVHTYIPQRAWFLFHQPCCSSNMEKLGNGVNDGRSGALEELAGGKYSIISLGSPCCSSPSSRSYPETGLTSLHGAPNKGCPELYLHTYPVRNYEQCPPYLLLYIPGIYIPILL